MSGVTQCTCGNELPEVPRGYSGVAFCGFCAAAWVIHQGLFHHQFTVEDSHHLSTQQLREIHAGRKVAILEVFYKVGERQLTEAAQVAEGLENTVEWGFDYTSSWLCACLFDMGAASSKLCADFEAVFAEPQRVKRALVSMLGESIARMKNSTLYQSLRDIEAFEREFGPLDLSQLQAIPARPTSGRPTESQAHGNREHERRRADPLRRRRRLH